MRSFREFRGKETKIGESSSRRIGFLGIHKEETLNFVIGNKSITLESRFFSQWIRYEGQRTRFLMEIGREEVDQNPDDDESKPTFREWRSFQFGDSRLEHHDYENQFRIFAPNEEEGILIGFIAFRFWADQYKETNQY